MSYKSIITYCDSTGDLSGRLSVAIDLTRQFDSHLTVLAIGVLPDLPLYVVEDMPAAKVDEMDEGARSRAGYLAGRAREVMTEAAVLGEVTPLVGTSQSLAKSFGFRGQFSDLIVIGAAQEAADASAAEHLTNGALFSSDIGVLVCPDSIRNLSPDAILVAWNGSRQALRAVRHALPFLHRSKLIEVAVVDSRNEAQSNASDLALFLSRHGLHVVVRSLPAAGRSVSEVLTERALDLGADLLVMGAYGHSRFAEMLLGGATHDLLKRPPAATLMAH
jgi:nucleotide-binding universal stress UspA family protein